MNEFYVPEEILEIENRELREIVMKAIGEKSKPLIFLDDDNKEVLFPENKHTRAQFQQWRNIIIKWAKDPYNPPHGIEGHGYDLFLGQMIKSVIDPKFTVLHTPSNVDFISNTDKGKWGPSADIIVGEWVEGKMKPSFLVSATLSGATKNTEQHKNLNVPIIGISENKFFPHTGGATFLFGTMNSPSSLIQKLSPAFKNTFGESIARQGFLYTLKK